MMGGLLKTGYGRPCGAVVEMKMAKQCARCSGELNLGERLRNMAPSGGELCAECRSKPAAATQEREWQEVTAVRREASEPRYTRDIPEAEMAALSARGREAKAQAAAGDVEGAVRCLQEGLEHAREADRRGHSWGLQLVALYHSEMSQHQRKAGGR
jgi:hypothetical protein